MWWQCELVTASYMICYPPSYPQALWIVHKSLWDKGLGEILCRQPLFSMIIVMDVPVE